MIAVDRQPPRFRGAIVPGDGITLVQIDATQYPTQAKPLTDVVIAPEAGVRTNSQRFRIADVAVADTMPDGRFTEAPPLVVVEVLSPSTRSEDTVRKSHEYATCGVSQYWIVDREARSLTAYSNNGAGWDVLLELDQDHPRGSVDVGVHGTVELDLVTLLGG